MCYNILLKRGIILEELEMVLRTHALRYPAMEPTDAVKLLYQNEFGGGHLIACEDSCRAYLEREWDEIPFDPEQILAEPIGNGLVRVHLAALQDRSWLFQAFVHSAREKTGNLESFLRKLETLKNLTRQGLFSFDSAQLEGYLEQYRAAGYPMVSHSQRYRQAYKPAYRIVLETQLFGGKTP